MKSQLINQKSLLVNEKRTNTVNVSKPVFVNNDGTIAESKASYQEFRADLNNRNYGW